MISMAGEVRGNRGNPSRNDFRRTTNSDVVSRRRYMGMVDKLSIGFLGAGKMATALARGFIAAGLVLAGRIVASDPVEAARSAFARETKAKTAASNADVMKSARVIILAVKPDQVAGVLKEIGGHFTEKHLLISIAAGVTIARLEGGCRPEPGLSG